jgi:hypothetical protein
MSDDTTLSIEDSERLRLADIRLKYGQELLDLLRIANMVGGRQGQYVQLWALRAAETLFVVDALKHRLIEGKSLIVPCTQCQKPLSMPDVARDHTICSDCRGGSDTPIDPSIYILSA